MWAITTCFYILLVEIRDNSNFSFHPRFFSNVVILIQTNNMLKTETFLFKIPQSERDSGLSRKPLIFNVSLNPRLPIYPIYTFESLDT